MFLSSSLFGKTEQKSEQKQLYCFHAALILHLLVLRSSSYGYLSMTCSNVVVNLLASNVFLRN